MTFNGYRWPKICSYDGNDRRKFFPNIYDQILRSDHFPLIVLISARMRKCHKRRDFDTLFLLNWFSCLFFFGPFYSVGINCRGARISLLFSSSLNFFARISYIKSLDYGSCTLLALNIIHVTFPLRLHRVLFSISGMYFQNTYLLLKILDRKLDVKNFVGTRKPGCYAAKRIVRKFCVEISSASSISYSRFSSSRMSSSHTNNEILIYLYTLE